MFVGEVREWPIRTVSKTVVPKGTVGSNPTLSASLRQGYAAGKPAWACKRPRAKVGKPASVESQDLTYYTTEVKDAKAVRRSFAAQQSLAQRTFTLE